MVRSISVPSQGPFTRKRTDVNLETKRFRVFEVKGMITTPSNVTPHPSGQIIASEEHHAVNGMALIVMYERHLAAVGKSLDL